MYWSGLVRIESLELAFATRSLRTLCECEKNAERELGVKMTSKLKRRLADLRAAATARDIVAGRPTATKGGAQELMTVNLGVDGRLVLAANHNEIPVLTNGAVDWFNVTRIKIVGIEVKHD